MFDIKTLVAASLAGMQLALKTDWNKVKPIALKLAADKEARLTQLATDYASGEFDSTFFADRVKDEGDIFLSEAAALKDVGQAMAENALNNFAQIFVQTVVNLIPAP